MELTTSVSDPSPVVDKTGMESGSTQQAMYRYPDTVNVTLGVGNLHDCSIPK